MNYVEQVILLTRLGYGLRDIMSLAGVDEPEVSRILKSPGKARHAYRTELEDKRAALAALRSAVPPAGEAGRRRCGRRCAWRRAGRPDGVAPVCWQRALGGPCAPRGENGKGEVQ